MKDYFYLNPSKMIELSKTLDGCEIKMLLVIFYCMNESGSGLFVNSADSRSKLAQLGFGKSPERISAILGSMVKKGVLKRELNGVYSLQKDIIKFL